MDALDTMTHRNDFCCVDGHESLSRKIVALHLVHGQCSSKVLQFGQLVLYRPGILRSLSRRDPFKWAGEVGQLHAGLHVLISTTSSVYMDWQCVCM